MVKAKKEKEKEAKLSETPPPVVLSRRAQDQLREAMKREQQKGVGVRILLVQVANGYRYDMQFESKEAPGDHISVQGGFKVYIDSIAANTLYGYLLDYQMFQGMEWGGFLFEKDKGHLDLS